MIIAYYKGTRPGIAGVYNRAVRWWTRSPYSHAELIFSDGVAASSSFADGGVRFKRIAFDSARWDFVEVKGDEVAARQWYIKRLGSGYDVRGIVGFVLGFVADSHDRYSCAESVAGALGYADAWRYSPAILHSVTSSTSVQLVNVEV